MWIISRRLGKRSVKNLSSDLTISLNRGRKVNSTRGCRASINFSRRKGRLHWTASISPPYARNKVKRNGRLPSYATRTTNSETVIKSLMIPLRRSRWALGEPTVIVESSLQRSQKRYTSRKTTEGWYVNGNWLACITAGLLAAPSPLILLVVLAAPCLWMSSSSQGLPLLWEPNWDRCIVPPTCQERDLLSRNVVPPTYSWIIFFAGSDESQWPFCCGSASYASWWGQTPLWSAPLTSPVLFRVPSSEFRTAVWV